MAKKHILEIPSLSKTRRLLGFHLKTTSTTETSPRTIFYIGEDLVPVALLSTARKNPSGFEVLFGRASGVPSSFAQTFEISERGVDIPPGVSFSLWASDLSGDYNIELMWC
jgi:hypothetical protein